MVSVYTNDLRLEEIGSGEQSGEWGDTTNTNLELIAEGLSYGTEGITTNADTHASTVADGASDPARSMYIEYTGTLDSACTITIGPNTLSRMHFIENGTSGSQNIIIKQGSGATITIPPGDTKAVYLDGAGSGAAVVDAFASLNVVDLKVQDDILLTSDSSAIKFGADTDVTLTHVADVGVALKSVATADDKPIILTLQTGETDIAANDVLGKISFQAPDEATGTDAILVAAAIQAISEGDFSSSSNATSLNFMTGASEAATTKFVIASDGSLSTPTLGTSNVRFGVNAGNSIASGGNYNTVVGDEAGTAISTGDANCLFGFRAGDEITTGNNHVAIGYDAAANMITGAYSIAIGTEALFSPENNGSIAIGYRALKTCNSTYRNTAIGYQAGMDVTDGSNITLVGDNAGQNIIDGGSIVAVGSGAFNILSTASSCTAVGSGAGGLVSTGVSNTFFGASCFANTSSGGYNVGMGESAGLHNTTGIYNTFIGDIAGKGISATPLTGASNTAVGTAAGYVLQGAAQKNTLIGGEAGDGITTGSYNTGMGFDVFSNSVVLTTGGQNCIIGAFSRTSAVNSDAANGLGYSIECVAGYTTVGNGANDIRAAHGNVTWATVSDERVKKDITDATAGLSFINDLTPRTFKYKDKGDIPEEFLGYEEGSTDPYKNDKTNHGFIAQEVKKVIEAHSEIQDGFSLWDVREKTGQQEVGEAALIPLLVKAIQELSTKNDALEARLTKLEG